MEERTQENGTRGDFEDKLSGRVDGPVALLIMAAGETKWVSEGGILNRGNWGESEGTDPDRKIGKYHLLAQIRLALRHHARREASVGLTSTDLLLWSVMPERKCR